MPEYNDVHWQEGNTMFSMKTAGANISKLRKAAGITQMELAEKMNIRFQAVSQWERGMSMPDISKLGELSGIFGVSIDEILNNKRASEIAGNILGNLPSPNLKLNEVADIAPFCSQAKPMNWQKSCPMH